MKLDYAVIALGILSGILVLSRGTMINRFALMKDKVDWLEARIYSLGRDAEADEEEEEK